MLLDADGCYQALTAHDSPADGLAFELSYRPPLAWEPLLAYLQGRGFAGVESVTEGCYRRTAALGGHAGWIAAAPSGKEATLRLEVSASLLPVLQPVLARVKHQLDLAAQPDCIEGALAEDPVLRLLVERHPGLRVPGAFDGFELALRAILGQQITVRAATTLAGRLAAAFGEPIETPFAGLTHLSPRPERLAAVPVAEIAALGLPRSRAVSIQALARAAAREALLLEPGVDVERTMARLQDLPGIGEWTAQYVALRALRWPDAFPHADLGLRKALGGVTAARAQELAERWRPWRGYAAVHLWKSLEKHDLQLL